LSDPAHLREVAERGRQMKSWAESGGGLFAIFDAVRLNYLETLTGSDITDATLREQTYHRIKALDDLRTAMDLVISEGAGAEATIDLMSHVKQKTRA
jgi:hypothetical protein